MGLTIRNFPTQLGIGTDLSSIPRWVTLLRSSSLRKGGTLSLTSRWMTPFEVTEFYTRYGEEANWDLGDLEKDITGTKNSNRTKVYGIASFLAGKWSAKEAVIKAVKPRKLTMREVELRRNTQTKEVFAVVLDAPVPLWKRSDYELAVAKLFKAKCGHGVGQTSASPAATKQSDESSSSALDSYVQGEDGSYEYEQDLSGQMVSISITHDGNYACAVALAVPDYGET